MRKPTKPKAPASQPTEVPAATPPFPRNLPMYFKGKRQSDEFARGAWAARDVLAKLQAHDGNKSTSEELAAMYADEFTDHAARGGDCARGLVTAMAEFLAFGHCVGEPSMEVWRPLEMVPVFSDEVDVPTQPTPGSKLYELDGRAVSVAPDCTVYAWNEHDEDGIMRGEAFLDRVQKHGRLLSQQEFDVLRARSAPGESSAPTTAVPAEADEDTTMASTPMDLVDHPAHTRINCATLGVDQLVVLTRELVERVSAEPADEKWFVAMALASRAHTLAKAASRLLWLPADEIDFEACEAEVCLG